MPYVTSDANTWAHPFVDVFAGLLAFSTATARRTDWRIATLGPAGTSSEHAARSFLARFCDGAGECRLYDSYEEAAASVTARANDLLLVANAYGRINEFYISDTLRLASFFVLDTPPYGLAVRPGTTIPVGREVTVATHHAPAHLLPGLTVALSLRLTPRLVESTSAAARLAASGEAEACITNEDARNRFGLAFLGPTRPVRMLWSVFAGADDVNIPGFPQFHAR
jgi:prephenate dehydratase